MSVCLSMCLCVSPSCTITLTPHSLTHSPPSTTTTTTAGALREKGRVGVGKENSGQLVGGERGIVPEVWEDGHEFVVSGHLRQAWTEA
mgnify:CR=1 FL=1